MVMVRPWKLPSATSLSALSGAPALDIRDPGALGGREDDRQRMLGVRDVRILGGDELRRG